MARNFSCNQWIYACSFYFSPTPSLSLYLNNTGTLAETPEWALYTGFHPPTSCSCGNSSGGGPSLYDSWFSGNTSIANITAGASSSSSTWDGAGVGSTTASFSGTTQFSAGGSLMCQAAQPANTMPAITWNGALVSSTTQNAVVGQQILLGGSPGGGTWSEGGTVVAGFNDGASVGPLTLVANTGTDVLFYWVASGSYAVTYTVNGQQARVTFSVAAPTYNGITFPTLLSPAVSTPPFLGVGNAITPVYGFIANASVTNPGGAAALTGLPYWTQLINSVVVEGTLAGGGYQVCSAGPGSDNGFPNAVGSTFKDAPGLYLSGFGASYPSVQESQSFSLYLMWNPGVGQNPIPIPLAVVNWNWDGCAALNSSGVFVTACSAIVESVTKTSSFPTWASIIRNGTLGNCGYVNGSVPTAGSSPTNRISQRSSHR